MGRPDPSPGKDWVPEYFSNLFMQLCARHVLQTITCNWNPTAFALPLNNQILPYMRKIIGQDHTV